MSQNALVMEIAGTRLPLIETAVLDRETKLPRADGRTYFVFRDIDPATKQFKKATGFGVGWAPITDKLPTSLTLDGQVLTLNAGMTSAEFKGKAKTPRPRVSFVGDVTLPSIGEPRTVDISISERADGLWNIKASVRRPGSSVSPEEATAKAKAKAQAANDVFAAFLSA